MRITVFPSVVPLLAFLLLAGCAGKAPKPETAPGQAYETGLSQFKSGSYKAAAETLATAAEEEPNRAEVQYLLGLSLQKSLTASAEAAFRKALALDPGHVPTMEALGVLYFSVGSFDAARPLLEEAAKRGGKSAEARVCLGDLLFFEGRCQDALTAYKNAAALDASHVPAAKRAEKVRQVCGKGQAATSSASGGQAPASSASPTPSKAGPKAIDLNDI